MRIIEHCLEGVVFVPSPNQDARPEPADISLIVVHGISLPAGHFGGNYVEKLFTNTLNPGLHTDFLALDCLKVSSHLFIRRDGQIVQFVPFNMRAWHAGNSLFDGRSACNDFSIGVELEGTDDGGYTPLQYRKLFQACQSLLATYPGIAPDRIVGHCHIAPDRKTDPGGSFDWPGFRALFTAL